MTLAVIALVNAIADPLGISLDINSPTYPALALLFVDVPTIPLVVSDQVILSEIIPVSVGLVAPTKFPVPVVPDKGELTLLFVAMIIPYATVILPCGPVNTTQSVFAVIQSNSMLSYWFVLCKNPVAPTVVLLAPALIT